MAKKESLKELNLKETAPELDLTPAPEPSFLSQKLSGAWRRLFGVIKFIFGICFLPLVYSTSVAFLASLGSLEGYLQDRFWWGAAAFLVVYLFVWEPAPVYAKGQKLSSWIFSFFKPLVRVAPYLLPIYTIVLFVLYLLFSLVTKSPYLVSYAVFLFGFTMALHLVFSAKSLRGRQGDFLKGNYIFGFSFVYILNLFLAALFFNSMFDKFSFVAFANNSFNTAGSIITAIFKQLFFVR